MLNFDPAFISQYFTVRHGFFTTVGVNKILAANASRVSVIFVAGFGNPGIWPFADASSQNSIQLNVSSAPVTFEFSKVGALVGGEWYGVLAGGTQVNWIEIIFTPPTG